jgi:rhamnose utilization protein RhaD (predicted bifunctional aldolase and dehydrogenase)
VNNPIADLVRLSNDLGREHRHFSILAEGNCSAKLGADEFAVKASGASLERMTEADVTVCNSAKVLALLDQKQLSDGDIETALMAARVDESTRRPSVESVFHAWLLTLDGVHCVGHCHPVSVNQVVCSPRARDFAERRLFPDEVVCCGASSVFIPYTDPGLPLAREIRDRTNAYILQNEIPPKLIILQNHGIIAVGKSIEAVLSCILMADKAASIFVGAAALGGPNFLTTPQVERIASRPDEAYRQQQLRI